MEEKNNMSEIIDEVKNASEEDLKKIIEQHFDAVRIQGMKIGAGYISAAVHGAIMKNLKKGANSSLRDHQRAIKAIEDVVSVQLTQQNDLDVAIEEDKA